MTDWRERAACRGADPDLWFADSMDTHNDKLLIRLKDATIAEAKDICVACPVRLICLDWAQNQNLKDGIFGGLTPRERDKEKRQRPRRPARCDICGGHYTPRSPSQRYCDKGCRQDAIRAQQNAYDRRHRAARREYKTRRKEAAA